VPEVSDPLAGYRKQINEGRVTVLRFPASKPCPVRPAERYPLQSCVIEVERVIRKLIKGKEAEWHVTFIRHEQDRPYMLRFTPPAHADSGKRTDPDASSVERARVESAYTQSAHSASPHEPESVGPYWKDKGMAERELARQDARAEREREIIQQAAKSRLNRLLKGASPEEAHILLAGIVALCEKAEASSLDKAA
jgi:hypothetical protein